MFNPLDPRRKSNGGIVRQLVQLFIGYSGDQGGGQPFQVNGGAYINGRIDMSGANGGQIKFPAAQNPSADANTLDDYEEGTFTLTDAYGVGGGTYFAQSYTKIGNRVFISFAIVFPSIASATTIRVTSLPFSAPTIQLAFGSAYSDYGEVVCAYWAAAGTALDMYISKSGAAISYLSGGGKRADFQGHFNVN